MADYFEILGLKKGASPQEIKRAYFSMVRKHSPEKDPEKFREIRDAYEHLQKMEDDQGPDLPGPTEQLAVMLLKEIEKYQKQGNKLQIRDACEEAYSLFPDELIFLYYMEIAQREAGNTGKAVKSAELLVKKQPENKWFWRELAVSYMERGFTQKALRAFEKGYELGCRDNDFILSFALECRDYGQYDKGMEILFEMVHGQKRWEKGDIPEVLEAYSGLLYMNFAGKKDRILEIMQELTRFVSKYSVYMEENLSMINCILSVFSYISEYTFDVYQAFEQLVLILEKACHSQSSLEMLKDFRREYMFVQIMHDDRLSEAVRRGIEAITAMEDEDPVIAKYALLDAELCMIEERQEVLPQLEILEREYSLYYEEIREFAQQLKSEQGLQPLKQKLLKPYFRLSSEISGGIYFEKYPQEAIRGRGKLLHGGDESSPYVRSEKKVGRNDPCPCGSGKKYKHCCGR